MGYRRDLKNKEQILHFPHIVRRLSILFYSFTNQIFNDTAVKAPHTPRSEHRRLPSKDHSESKPRRRVLSQQLDPRIVQEFSIPDLPRSFLLTPTEPLTPSQSSHVSFEVEQYPENDVNSSEVERRRGHRPLLLLTRSRGTQTENWPGLLPPSPIPLPSQLSSLSSHDGQSESSSFSDSLASSISTILERVLALLNRMSQADALTLTNRLKRQNLKGADIGHLSRSTVSHILSKATSLRAQFRSVMEDDKVVLACTRKDMRLLFKFIMKIDIKQCSKVHRQCLPQILLPIHHHPLCGTWPCLRSNSSNHIKGNLDIPSKPITTCPQ